MGNKTQNIVSGVYVAAFAGGIGFLAFMVQDWSALIEFLTAVPSFAIAGMIGLAIALAFEWAVKAVISMPAFDVNGSAVEMNVIRNRVRNGHDRVAAQVPDAPKADPVMERLDRIEKAVSGTPAAPAAPAAPPAPEKPAEEDPDREKASDALAVAVAYASWTLFRAGVVITMLLTIRPV